MTTNFPQRWRMPVLLRASFALHAAALMGVILHPPAWPWALAALAANHALLTAVGLWPRSTWLGANWTSLPAASAARNEIALTIDDGPDPEVTPAVLDLLDRHGVKASFFCIGKHAARYPELCREIVARGHQIENHSQRHHHNFSLLGRSGFDKELRAAQDTLTAVSGSRPQFFRAPAGLRNPFLDPVLARLGLRLAAWTRRGFDTRCADAATVSARLTRNLKAGDILLIHDGNAARTAEGQPVILQALPPLFDAAAIAGLRFVTLRDALDHTPADQPSSTSDSSPSHPIHP